MTSVVLEGVFHLVGVDFKTLLSVTGRVVGEGVESGKWDWAQECATRRPV